MQWKPCEEFVAGHNVYCKRCGHLEEDHLGHEDAEPCLDASGSDGQGEMSEQDRLVCENSALRAALEEIASQPCRNHLLCRESCVEESKERSDWCMPCRAQVSLAEIDEKKKCGSKPRS